MAQSHTHTITHTHTIIHTHTPTPWHNHTHTHTVAHTHTHFMDTCTLQVLIKRRTATGIKEFLNLFVLKMGHLRRRPGGRVVNSWFKIWSYMRGMLGGSDTLDTFNTTGNNNGNNNEIIYGAPFHKSPEPLQRCKYNYVHFITHTHTHYKYMYYWSWVGINYNGKKQQISMQKKKMGFQFRLKRREWRQMPDTCDREKKRVPNHRSDVLKEFLPHFDLLDLNEEERDECPLYLSKNHLE